MTTLPQAAPATLPIAGARKPLAEYRLDFEVPKAGRYQWHVRVLSDEDARLADSPVAYDPNFKIWWQTVLIDRDTGEVLGTPLLPSSLGVQAQEA